MPYVIKEPECGMFLTESINDNPDDSCWGEPYSDEPLIFETKEEAEKLVKKFSEVEDGFWCEEKSEPEKVQLFLTNEEKEILKSTLTCTLARAYAYGSFGNNNTKFDSGVIGNIISQLEKY